MNRRTSQALRVWSYEHACATILAALAVGVSLLAGCGSTPSHRPAAQDRQEQVVTVTGAVGPPESPQEKQLERELEGVTGASE